MTKRKLNLDELKVESFVTSFDAQNDGTVKGGALIPKEDITTTIPNKDTPIYTSGDLHTPKLTETRFTFMEADTGGCKHTDIGCPKLPKL